MKKIMTLLVAAQFALSGFCLSGCASRQAEQAVSYDFGPLPPLAESRPLHPLIIADVNAPAWLDSHMMFFRLGYANDRQPRSYANSRWVMPPAQLFGQRLKARIAQAGGAALSESDGAVNLPSVHIENDDFIQLFTAPDQSAGQVTMRVSVLNGRLLLGQKSFTRQVPAPSPDATGGAQALASASDALITDVIAWLAGLPLKKQ